MLRYAFGAVAVLVFTFGAARGDEILGVIKKIEDGKITFASKFDKETKKFQEEKTYPLAKGVKVVNAKFNFQDRKAEVGEPLENGLKNERFKDLSERGVFSQIVTNNDGQVTEIRVFPPFKKKSE